MTKNTIRNTARMRAVAVVAAATAAVSILSGCATTVAGIATPDPDAVAAKRDFNCDPAIKEYCVVPAIPAVADSVFVPVDLKVGDPVRIVVDRDHDCIATLGAVTSYAPKDGSTMVGRQAVTGMCSDKVETGFMNVSDDPRTRGSVSTMDGVFIGRTGIVVANGTKRFPLTTISLYNNKRSSDGKYVHTVRNGSTTFRDPRMGEKLTVKGANGTVTTKVMGDGDPLNATVTRGGVGAPVYGENGDFLGVLLHDSVLAGKDAFRQWVELNGSTPAPLIESK